jgi:phosphotransferase system enzyme I (PtsP)
VCSVYLTDPDLTHLTLRATIGLAPGSVGRVRLAFGQGLVGLAAERGEVIAIEHASGDPNYEYFPETGEEQYESLVAAPLMVRGGTIGVLVIQSRESRGFDAQDTVLLQTCAQLLAPVVVNAQLLDLVGRSDDDRSRTINTMRDSRLTTAGGLQGRGEWNVELRGIPAARGVAIGPVHRVASPVRLDTVEYTPSADPAEEAGDLRRAIADARREIDEMRDVMGDRFGPEFAAVFYTQMQILEDKGFIQALDQAVEREASALGALRSVLQEYKRTFERIEDPYFRERGADVQDVGQRVAEKLLGVRQHVEPMEQGALVVVDQIVPGLFERLEMDKVGGFLAEHGGATSHGAIFARSLEVPAVTGAPGILQKARQGETAIVDGATGRIYLSPDEGVIEEYQRAQQRHAVAVEHLDALRERPAETRDGHRVILSANVGLINDLRLVERHGAEGVGLFRTELLALAHRGFPNEEEQEQLYERVCSLMAPSSVTIRTLDLGGDKGIPNIGLEEEENPQLGCRSIRLTLVNEPAFLAQLRAVLRASAHGNVRLLIPMISCIDELRQTRVLVDRAKEQLSAQGVAFDENIPVGVMIEVPSAALMAESLAQECDFFSIGTNDLTQYTLAVDRGNERVAHLYDPLHPAVLALIDRSARAAARAGIPATICGEIATNPLAVPILVGLDVGELSGTPSAVPVVKEIIRALDFGETTDDARRALESASAKEVHAIGAERIVASGLLDHPDIGDWLRVTVEENLV